MLVYTKMDHNVMFDIYDEVSDYVMIANVAAEVKNG